MKNNFDLRSFLTENKLTQNSKALDEQLDFDLSMQVQALINKLIDEDPDLLRKLEKMTEWNELVKMAVNF